MKPVALARTSVRIVTSGFLVCATLSISHAADMIGAIQAVGPHPSLGDEPKALGRVVGTWDVEYTDYLKDGTVSHRTGEFIVGWVLDGRGVQDLWIVDPPGAGKDREVYTTLYYYEAKSRTWHATFVDPEHAAVLSFTGGTVGKDRFVLETQDSNSKETRWSFNDIRCGSFIWRDEQSTDGGKTWRLKSEYHMKRHAPHHAARLDTSPGNLS